MFGFKGPIGQDPVYFGGEAGILLVAEEVAVGVDHGSGKMGEGVEECRDQVGFVEGNICLVDVFLVSIRRMRKWGVGGAGEAM